MNYYRIAPPGIGEEEEGGEGEEENVRRERTFSSSSCSAPVTPRERSPAPLPCKKVEDAEEEEEEEEDGEDDGEDPNWLMTSVVKNERGKHGENGVVSRKNAPEQQQHQQQHQQQQQQHQQQHQQQQQQHQQHQNGVIQMKPVHDHDQQHEEQQQHHLRHQELNGVVLRRKPLGRKYSEPPQLSHRPVLELDENPEEGGEGEGKGKFYGEEDPVAARYGEKIR